MKIFKNSGLLIVGLLFFSCTEDKAILLDDVDDSIKNYQIPKAPVNTNYTVGAIYKMEFIKRTDNETPSIGQYIFKNIDFAPPPNNLEDPLLLSQAYSKHVKQAQTAGVDFFIFNRRSFKAIKQYNYDKGLVDILQTAPNAGDMKFAFSYNFGAFGLKKDFFPDFYIETLNLQNDFVKDFELMIPYFEKSNYMIINDKGVDKAVVYIFNSHSLFSLDNRALYKKLRDDLRAKMKMSSNPKLQNLELYLIGMQPEWTPPLRYIGEIENNRFEGCVDALTITNYANINRGFTERKNYFHNYIDQAWSYHKETLAKYNVEFVPTISPSYNSANVNNYDIPKNADWFKANCNIARRASGANKLVLIDSFNDWNLDTQIESATSYGDMYLKIVKSEFKLNQQ
jgi:hypothetical protein